MRPVHVRYGAGEGARWSVCGRHHLRPCPYGCPLDRPANAVLTPSEKNMLERLGLYPVEREPDPRQSEQEEDQCG